MRIKLSIEAEVQASGKQALKELQRPQTCPDGVVACRVEPIGSSSELFGLVGSLLTMALSIIFGRSLACFGPLA